MSNEGNSDLTHNDQLAGTLWKYPLLRLQKQIIVNNKHYCRRYFGQWIARYAYLIVAKKYITRFSYILQFQT